MKCVFNKSKPILGLKHFAECNPLHVTPKTRKSKLNDMNIAAHFLFKENGRAGSNSVLLMHNGEANNIFIK